MPRKKRMESSRRKDKKKKERKNNKEGEEGEENSVFFLFVKTIEGVRKSLINKTFLCQRIV